MGGDILTGREHEGGMLIMFYVFLFFFFVVVVVLCFDLKLIQQVCSVCEYVSCDTLMTCASF